MRADQPVPVFPIPFDWRRRLDEVESELAEFVDEVIARTRLLRHYHVDGYGSARPARVNLVGHSMGGLVLTGYLAREGFAKVGRVATLGSPFRGSHEAILKVATGSAEIGPTPGRPRERWRRVDRSPFSRRR